MIVDDHAIVVEGLRRILDPEFEVVAVVSDSVSFLDKAVALKPDVALVDISIPGAGGMECVRRLRPILPSTRFIMLTMHSGAAYVREALALGASGYVIKSSAPSELLHAIRQALAGRVYVTPLVTKDTGDSLLAPQSSGVFEDVLTRRQWEVLRMIAQGKNIKEIAADLNLSPRTVDFHRASIMQKLHVKSVAELVRYALQRGLVA